MDFISYLSDKTILGFLQTVKNDYFILATVVAPGVLWLIRKFTGWTPWTSDDDLADKLSDSLGIDDGGSHDVH